jgi:hypothetical protein
LILVQDDDTIFGVITSVAELNALGAQGGDPALHPRYVSLVIRVIKAALDDDASPTEESRNDT